MVKDRPKMATADVGLVPCNRYAWFVGLPTLPCEQRALRPSQAMVFGTRNSSCTPGRSLYKFSSVLRRSANLSQSAGCSLRRHCTAMKRSASGAPSVLSRVAFFLKVVSRMPCIQPSSSCVPGMSLWPSVPPQHSGVTQYWGGCNGGRPKGSTLLADMKTARPPGLCRNTICISRAVTLLTYLSAPLPWRKDRSMLSLLHTIKSHSPR
mmetsp:Transcript_56442/g.175100  ORF Transcript_56442/g.175100 Transcript_56442/m.175100 type:complete len:208 (+) Transcript_56442:454-1077(+)